METAVMEKDTKQESLLHEVWAVELEILDVIDQICKKHDIQYALFFGTLLGAVRHRGFIPWDDDIDVLMSRDDYERFRRVWRAEAIEDYDLVDREAYPDYPNNFLKIVKKHTTFLQLEKDRERAFPKGFFVDVFPADRFAPEGLARRFQYACCLVNLLFTRNYGSNRGRFTSIVETVLLRLPYPLKEKLRLKTKQLIQRWNDRKDLPILILTVFSSCRKLYPVHMLDRLVDMEFQGRSYPAPAEYEGALNTIYLNYRQLPPEEKRVWTHHPILLDFEHDYEQLQQ